MRRDPRSVQGVVLSDLKVSAPTLNEVVMRSEHRGWCLHQLRRRKASEPFVSHSVQANINPPGVLEFEQATAALPSWRWTDSILFTPSVFRSQRRHKNLSKLLGCKEIAVASAVLAEVSLNKSPPTGGSA